ncbi:MAG: fatty acid desaturase [Bdellovibrionota bacterium]
MEPKVVPAVDSVGSVDPKVLRQTIDDLQVTSPWPGFFKAMGSLAIMGVLIWVSLTRESTLAFVLWACATAFFYSSIFLLTHDAIHHTLTGWNWFDELFPRVLAYPMLWYHGIYSALHKIHHKMNGNDIHDPERPQYTEREYKSVGPVRQWMIRNQWWLNCFVWGGFGFLFKHYWQAYKFYNKSREVRLAIWTDVAGVLLVQGFINVWAYSVGNWWHAFAFFLILERIMGAFHQFRSHIEHYGLWGKEANPFETQIRNSRNLRTTGFMSLYVDHLNYHSVHHAFPRIPFYQLKEAHRRLVALYERFGRPMAEDTSYVKTGWRLATNPVVAREETQQVIPIADL